MHAWTDPSDVNDEPDFDLASNPELVSAAAASQPPSTEPPSTEGPSSAPSTTPEPPAKTTSQADPTVKEKLAQLAVDIAGSEAAKAVVARVASTGSTSSLALDCSISELGIDHFVTDELTTIPEAEEADYSFRFLQFSASSADSQDTKKN